MLPPLSSRTFYHCSAIKGVFDVAIIGLGPSGLAAAARLGKSGLRVAVIESGKSVHRRNRYSPRDATRGHGGAGLFSDGKFSFFPSASELWSLPRESDLRAAYAWTCDILGAAGLDTPPFPTEPAAYSMGMGDWVLKDYPSDYLSLSARLKLVGDMVADVDGEIFDERQVDSITYDSPFDGFAVNTRHLDSENTTPLLARRLILTTGRFGPLSKCLLDLTRHHSFRRLEVGYRIEQARDQAFFRDMKQLDPKFRFIELDGGVEWRTFCACRQGEAVLSETEGLWTVSGRSDCPPTGRSNSGFNTRILDESLASRVIAPVLRAMANVDSHFEVSMAGLLGGDPETVAVFDKVYGPELRVIMTRGLSHLVRAFPCLGTDKNARLIGPTFEGVGWYPNVDGDLRLSDVPAWVAGDACGLFRGIVAAMISGHYAAASVLHELQPTLGVVSPQVGEGCGKEGGKTGAIRDNGS